MKTRHIHKHRSSSVRHHHATNWVKHDYQRPFITPDDSHPGTYCVYLAIGKGKGRDTVFVGRFNNYHDAYNKLKNLDR